MAGKIPDEVLQAIRDRISIVEVVSGYVTLRKAGRSFLGLCPFHGEKTPSFTVSDERGLFHCFGCGAGGTVFTFLMRADRLTFPEAVEVLARKAGVTLPQRRESGPGGEQRQQLLAVNEAAQRYFRDAYRGAAGSAARRYLQGRRLSAATVEHYGLGFCPAGAGLAQALVRTRGAQQHATQLGLVGRRHDGRVYDRFGGRVTFPIRDGSGRILGFGGRTLGSDHPKYLNSPESPLFHKGQVLYGLFEARDAIRDADRVVIVEGYLDALALVEAGIGHAVASLGTALTVPQLRLAQRFAPEIVAFFDGDRAGQEAAVRAFGVCAEAGAWGLGAFLPEGFDPDTFVRQRGRDATLALLHAAVPLADFFLERLDPGADAPLPMRARAAEKVGEVICRYRDRDGFKFDLLVKKAAQQLGVDEVLFRDLRVKTMGTEMTRHVSAAVVAPENERFRPEETTLVEAMALDREVAVLVEHRGILDAFANAQLAEAGQALVDAWAAGDATAALDLLPSTLAARVTAGLMGEGAVATGDRLQVARDCIDRIERRRRRQQSRAVLAALRQAEASGDEARMREQLERNNELIRKEIGRG